MKLKWVIPVIGLVLAILAVALAMERRKTLVRLAVGVALMSLLLLGDPVGRARHLHRPGLRRWLQSEGAAAVWDTVLRFFKSDLRWTLLISVLVAFGGLGGRAGPLRRVDPQDLRQRRRAGWRRSTGHSPRGPGRAAAESSRVRRTGGWIVEHLAGLRIVGVVVAGLILVFSGNLTGWTLLVIVLVLAVYLGLLQLVAAWARRVALAGGGSCRRRRQRRRHAGFRCSRP